MDGELPGLNMENKGYNKQELDIMNYTDYLENLSKQEILAILKWEIHNRIFLSEKLARLEEKLSKLEG